MRAQLLLLIFCLTACQQAESPPEPTTFSGTSMTMPYRLIVGKHLDESQERAVREIVTATFNETNEVYNKWNPSSELSLWNRARAGEEKTLSIELEKLLLITDELVKLSEGRFDPTIETLQQVWKEALERGERPTGNLLAEVKPTVGWNQLLIQSGKLTKKHDYTQIDLGGIAKGYCVDLIVERLNSAGYKDVFFDWGGEIRASGQHPEGRPWKIYIRSLESTHPDNAIATLELNDEAIATSGDYNQYWVVNKGEKSEATYCHVIDPLTKEPLQITGGSIASVSVRARTCALADGLATTAMLMGSHKEADLFAKQIEQMIPSTSFWILSRPTSYNGL